VRGILVSVFVVSTGCYHREIDFAPFPMPGEDIPLFLSIGVREVPMTRGAVHAIVKKVFENTSIRLRQSGEQIRSIADRIEQAAVDWLRHTAGLHIANSDVDLRHVRDNLGHESIRTTNNSLHSSDDVRHRETEAKHKIKW